jgi:hypothetical protein
MPVPWIVPVALAAAVLLLVVRALGPRLFPGTLVWRYEFRCPVKVQDVSAELRESVWDGRRLDVRRCSAFTPSEDVQCNKACTLLARLPRPARAPFRPLGELCACWRLTGRGHG